MIARLVDNEMAMISKRLATACSIQPVITTCASVMSPCDLGVWRVPAMSSRAAGSTGVRQAQATAPHMDAVRAPGKGGGLSESATP